MPSTAGARARKKLDKLCQSRKIADGGCRRVAVDAWTVIGPRLVAEVGGHEHARDLERNTKMLHERLHIAEVVVRPIIKVARRNYLLGKIPFIVHVEVLYRLLQDDA
jgi:hypothetical protein